MCFTFAVTQVIVITTVCFKCTAGPSIISKDRIWAIVKKVADHWSNRAEIVHAFAYTIDINLLANNFEFSHVSMKETRCLQLHSIEH